MDIYCRHCDRPIYFDKQSDQNRHVRSGSVYCTSGWPSVDPADDTVAETFE